MQKIKKFIQNEEGATAIEYGLIALLISVAIIGSATALGSSIPQFFNFAGDKINGVL